METRTLGDFVRHVATQLTTAREGFPYNEEEPWHVMLLYMRNKYGSKWDFLGRIKFDVGEVPYPRCRKLSDFLQALHWSGALTVENPTYAKARVIQSLAKEWEDEESRQDEKYRALVDEAVQEFMFASEKTDR